MTVSIDTSGLSQAQSQGVGGGEGDPSRYEVTRIPFKITVRSHQRSSNDVGTIVRTISLTKSRYRLLYIQ